MYPKDDFLRTDPASLGDPVPCKPPTCTGTLPVSPSGVADDAVALASVLGGSTYTTSQPNSATSSLASFLHDGELQVSSRHSSASDLGARPSLPQLALPSAAGDLSTCSSARSDISSHEEAVELLERFDSGKLQSLSKIKTRSPKGIMVRSCSTEPTPAAPGHVHSLASSIFSSIKSAAKEASKSPAAKGVPAKPIAQVCGPAMTVRPMRTRPVSQPGTYNPYDLAGLLADFKLQRSLSPSNARPAPLREKTASRFVPGCAAAEPDRDLDSVVMIPGARRVA